MNKDKFKQSEEISNELAALAKGEETGKELVFDSVTGELVVKKQGDISSSPDGTIITSIVEDGFF